MEQQGILEVRLVQWNTWVKSEN